MYQKISKDHPKVIQTAKITKLSPEEVVERLEKLYDGKTDVSLVSLDAAPESKDLATTSEIRIPINLDLGIIALKGYILFRSGVDWKLEINIGVYLFGVRATEIKLTIDARNPSFCLDYNLGVVWGNLCFGVEGSRLCFYIGGKVCSFGGCTPFKETIVCFK